MRPHDRAAGDAADEHGPADEHGRADVEGLAERFEQHRPYLHAVAARLLGSPADAEDAVQEAWLRLSRAGEDGIRDLRAWLTTVTTRIALDTLRRGRVGRDAPFSMSLEDLRGPTELPDPARGPEEEILLAESVELALRGVLAQLTPAERVAFVLHDVFEIPFASIGSLLERSPDAAKMLATRARQRLRRAGDPTGATGATGPTDPADQSVIDAFLTATAAGDMTGVLAVLAPDLRAWHSFAQGDPTVLGRDELAGRATFGARLGGSVCRVTVDGAPGAIVLLDGKPTTVMAFETRAGVITRIRSITDPLRLAQIVPSWVL